MNTRFCKCGCGQIVTSKNPNVLYIKGHIFRDKKRRYELMEKSKQTTINRYGVSNVSELKKKPVYCKCGCGGIVDRKTNPGAIYIPGHYIKRPMTEEEKEKRTEKTKKTCLEKYGVDNVSKREDVIELISKTLKDINNDPKRKQEIIDKRKETTKEKYGVDCITQSQLMKDKSKHTCLERYGTEYANQSEEVYKRTVETNIRKYGYKYTTQVPQIIEKMKESYIKNLGVDNPAKSEEVKEKIKQTNLEKFGVEWSRQCPEIVEKGKQTCLERYGVSNPYQVKEIQNKTKRKWLEKYGVDNPTKCKEIVDKSTKWIKDIAWKKIENQEYWQPLFNKEDFKGWKVSCSDERLSYKFKCKKCGHEQEFNNSLLLRCPVCFPEASRSIQENEILEYLNTILDPTLIIHNDREILNGKELDIYIPSKNIAIEFNGLYWHSNKFITDNNYHLNKLLECEKRGIHLIHIFEDDWYSSKNIVKSRLNDILGIYHKTIYARKCEVRLIEDSSYLQFLDDNHIQGYISSSHALGLYYNNELISCMTFGKYRRSMGRNSVKDEYEMYRFCNKIGYHIPGAASRLLKYFILYTNPKKIISYADMCWSQGNLYRKLDFKWIKNTTPNYWYVKGYFRENRYKYRKSELPKLLKHFDPNQSEQQNMINNGYNIVYDCGSMLFEWTNPNYQD